jgi:hypothetical protein
MKMKKSSSCLDDFTLLSQNSGDKMSAITAVSRIMLVFGPLIVG